MIFLYLICLPLDWLQSQEKHKLLDSWQHWTPDSKEREIRKFIVDQEPQFIPEHTELLLAADQL
jgi:hypothetical protein